MGSTPEGPYGLIPPGQPVPLADGEWEPAQRRPRLFGQGYRELSGVPRLIIIPQPTVGADWSYAHGGPSWLLIRAVRWQLVTSATVVTRVTYLAISYQSTLFLRCPPAAGQGASLTTRYNFMATTYDTAGGQDRACAIPEVLIVKDAMTIASSTDNLQVGDQMSLVTIFGEEFTDRCIDGLW